MIYYRHLVEHQMVKSMKKHGYIISLTGDMFTKKNLHKMVHIMCLVQMYLEIQRLLHLQLVD